MDYRPITVATWRAAVRRKHARSSTGPDGVSRVDLLLLPLDLTQALLDLCHHAEATGEWPRQMLDGVVTALEKIPDASLVGQFRPITVLSLTYRVWSSIRARQCLAHLARYAPPGLLGNLPGHEAREVWYTLQLLVESSYHGATPVSGFTADLSKAYNLLPRAPVLAFAAVCGIHGGIIRAWTGALSGFMRRFRVRGSLGPALPSTTGFPEGDGLSCVAMVLVNMAYHDHMSAQVPELRVLTFVDTWEALARDPSQVLQPAAAQESFIRSWDLELDPAKTKFWATQPRHRALFRAAGNRVALDFKELGAHFQASRRHTNSTQVARFKDLKPRSRRLAASLSPICAQAS